MLYFKFEQWDEASTAYFDDQTTANEEQYIKLYEEMYVYKEDIDLDS